MAGSTTCTSVCRPNLDHVGHGSVLLGLPQAPCSLVEQRITLFLKVPTHQSSSLVKACLGSCARISRLDT